MWRLGFTFIICILAAAVGCDDISTRSRGTGQSADFPNSVGSQWQYAVYDSIGGILDTITVEIVDTVTLSETGELAHIWAYHPLYPNYGFWFDTVFVTISKTPALSDLDTVKIYAARTDDEPWQIYLIPMSVGDYWINPFNFILGGYDSTHVARIKTAHTPAGTFRNALEVLHFYGCGFECSGQQTSAYQRGIGMVESHWLEHDVMSGGPDPVTNTTWELVGYDIPGPKLISWRGNRRGQ